MNRPDASLRTLFVVMLLFGAGDLLAQSPKPTTTPAPSPAKVCADRWNEMKVKNQTGDLTFADFAKQCLAEAAPPSSAAQAAKPGETAPKRTTPTGPSAAAAQPSMKQCADLWNELKAKKETGDQTYRDFAQQCLAGSLPDDKPEPAEKPEEKAAAPKPRTSVPPVAARPTPDPAPSLSKQPDESDREALNRCNAEWGDYKSRHNLSGAKAWHVFMARCLP